MRTAPVYSITLASRVSIRRYLEVTASHLSHPYNSHPGHHVIRTGGSAGIDIDSTPAQAPRPSCIELATLSPRMPKELRRKRLFLAAEQPETH